MKKTSALIEIVINSLNQGPKKGYYNRGICGEILDLGRETYVTLDEARRLVQVVEKHPPIHQWSESYYWPPMNRVPNQHQNRQVRIEYLIKLKEKYEAYEAIKD